MKEKLYIPNNVKNRSEFFDGFGFSELIGTFAITGVVFGISFIIYLFANNLSLLILSVLITASVGVAILTKDRTNQSVLDYATNMILFSKSQKKYEYERSEVHCSHYLKSLQAKKK